MTRPSTLKPLILFIAILIGLSLPTFLQASEKKVFTQEERSKFALELGTGSMNISGSSFESASFLGFDCGIKFNMGDTFIQVKAFTGGTVNFFSRNSSLSSFALLYGIQTRIPNLPKPIILEISTGIGDDSYSFQETEGSRQLTLISSLSEAKAKIQITQNFCIGAKYMASLSSKNSNTGIVYFIQVN